MRPLPWHVWHLPEPLHTLHFDGVVLPLLPELSSPPELLPEASIVFTKVPSS
jgi:hypothetical protein